MRSFFLICTFLVASALGYAQTGYTLLSLEKDYRAGRVRPWRVNTSWATPKLQAEFTTQTSYPTLTVLRAKPSNWSGYDAFLLDIENPNSYPIQFYVRLDDDPSADGWNHCRTGYAYIQPFTTRTYCFPLRIDPAAFGMKGIPGLNGATWLSMNSAIVNIANIIKWHVYVANPSSNRILLISNPRLAKVNNNFTNIVDKYGQYTRTEWPGKIHSDAELANEELKEELDLSRNPGPPSHGFMGGYHGAATYDPYPRFHERKIGNNWWLLTPGGLPFLSFGLNAVDGGDPTTLLNRYYMFSWLPETTDPLAAHYGRITDILPGSAEDGATYNFYSANLQRKFGTNYSEAYEARATDRFNSWGFTTLGNWSRPSTWQRQEIPYTVRVEFNGSGHTRLQVDPKRAALHDPFDPAFRIDVRASVAAVPQFVIDDPWCLGWFMDNEPTVAGVGQENGRYAVAYAALNKFVFDSPAKVALMADLQAKYPAIEGLNAAWGSSFASWETIMFPLALDESTATAGRNLDFSLFCRHYFDEYFRVMREELRLRDSTVMFLGCRFFRYSTECLEAAADHCDVLSFNIYATALGSPWNTSTYAYLNKPFLISEFHFGALDRGMFHPGLVSSSDQAHRGQLFASYVNSVIDNPLFVGCHWHKYTDEPLTGRVVDGENYNEGFVSGTDFPYPELVSAARSVLYPAYSRRWARN